MNFKLKGRTLLNGDIISPEIPYAVFDEGLSKPMVKYLVSALNYGHDMLMVYQQYRDNMHIRNVVEMLERLEEIHKKFYAEGFASRRETE